MTKTRPWLLAAVGAAFLGTVATPAIAQTTKPNIVVIFGDDIGTWNVGAYTHGMMGKTPNIDSIAKTGALSIEPSFGRPLQA